MSPAMSVAEQTWWQKPLIWGVFLGLLYVLRDFFLIGFLTFLVCFIVRGFVGIFGRRMFPKGLTHGVDLALTLSILMAICLLLYGLGRYFVPSVIREGKSLVMQLKNTSAPELQSNLLANTVGTWQFRNRFGTPQDERYQIAFHQFQQSGRDGEGLYRTFPQLEARLQADFEAQYEQALILQLQTSEPKPSAANEKTDPSSRWEQSISPAEWTRFRQSTDYQSRFKEFYEKLRKDDPVAVPIGYSLYELLAAAYPNGQTEFQAAFRQYNEMNQETVADQEHDFQAATRLELAQKWWATSHVADWFRDHVKNDGPKILESIVLWFDRAFHSLVRVPIQIATALLLSIFILVGWQDLKQGVNDLRDSRLQRAYDEIMPGIVVLGKLVGKTFQGQILIAAFNAALTLLAMSLIGIKYKFVLALAVFLFSFIPVVGVILSGFPICTVAIVQPGGSLLMALQVIVAIAVTHMIEGMVLAPRVIGKIGHLHPVLVIVILLVAEHFFGMWGLILGVPVAIYLIRIVILNKSIPGIYEPEQPMNSGANLT